MFKDNFVAVVKNNGSILREKDGVITLPFNSEYSILLKNLNSRKVSVKIDIDSEDILDSNSIIINPNSSTELLGFLEGDEVRKRFKFIQKTKEIADYSGDNIDDGIIRIEFAFEKPVLWTWTSYYYSQPIQYFPYESNTIGNGSSVWLSNSSNSYDSTHPSNDEGITVRGSDTEQKFYTTTIGELEEPQIISFLLRGEGEDGSKVIKPITIKDKITCSICGKTSKSDAKFCYNCGASLT
jgi:hypothetical protein